MNITNPKFIISATCKAQYPNDNLPEIVLIGKSNIGKSSFINCICNRNKLAKTSSAPGKTRLINFYNIDEKFYFVDLPGYGYSQMSKKEEQASSKFIDEYLATSKKIALIFFLVDIRHEPTNNDIIMFNWLIRNQKKFVLVANKADKIAKTKINDYINVITLNLRLKEYGLKETINVIPFSSINKLGKDDILNIIEKEFLNKTEE